MKLLAICSSLDLRHPHGCTPSWWQLLKGLAELGVDVAAIAYSGSSVETLWWKAYANPCRFEGVAFTKVRQFVRRVPARQAQSREAHESMAERLTRLITHNWIMPRWQAHLDHILRRDGPFDAVIVLTVPLNHLVGLAGHLQSTFGVPVFYYDGDLPASLPRFQGFQTGFRIYQGANLAEYTGFIANSKGGAEELRAAGAPNVHVLYYGADPSVFAPRQIQQDIDIFFYGHGGEYRENWIRDMLTIPSEELADLGFAMRGTGFTMPLGRVRTLPYMSVAKLREYCCRSRLNLVITRQAHASVCASSNARPFELAAMGATMVANPMLGVEEWFEPGKEIIVVNSREEAQERYRWLIAHDAARRAIGKRAHRRFLAEHTYAHRARQLIDILKSAA